MERPGPRPCQGLRPRPQHQSRRQLRQGPHQAPEGLPGNRGQGFWGFGFSKVYGLGRFRGLAFTKAKAASATRAARAQMTKGGQELR